MVSRKSSITFALVLSMASLEAWDARFSPEEANVNWLPPEDAFEQNVFILPRPDLEQVNLLTGLLQVDGADAGTPFIARIDGNGMVEWSKRLPSSTLVESLDETTLIKEDTLLTNATVGDPGSERELIGNFDPTNNFAPRYQFSLPVPAMDPLDFSDEGLRSYQPQPSGNLAIVEIEENEVKVLMLDPQGNDRFARVYTMPSGEDDSPFPIPGFGDASYDFASVTETDNGDYFLSTSSSDFATQSGKAYALRLDSSGSIIWQAEVEVPGSMSFFAANENDRLILSSSTFTEEAVSSSIVVLSPDGGLDFARSVDGALVSNTSFYQRTLSGDFLFTATIPDPGLDIPAADGAIFMLSAEGEMLSQVGFDIDDSDLAFHIGPRDDSLYFELIGQDMDEDEGMSTGYLARSDRNLENWIFTTHSETSNARPLASLFFSENNDALMVTQDPSGDWVSANEIGPDLRDLGECNLLVEADLPLFDPNLTIQPLDLTVNRNAVTAADWTDPPVRTPESFDLVDTPLVREATCGDDGGGGDDGGDDNGDDPTSLWADVSTANAEGDKLAGIGWINDTNFPFVWIYAINGWAYILEEVSTLNGIFGWDYVNGFWFWTNDSWGGWYVNLDDPEWGVDGWDQWE